MRYQKPSLIHAHKEHIPISHPTSQQYKQEESNQPNNYYQELQIQIEEKKRRRDKERMSIQRKEQEQLSYDPFGKQGSGAPMRDTEGNIITTRVPIVPSPKKNINQKFDSPFVGSNHRKSQFLSKINNSIVR